MTKELRLVDTSAAPTNSAQAQKEAAGDSPTQCAFFIPRELTVGCVQFAERCRRPVRFEGIDEYCVYHVVTS